MVGSLLVFIAATHAGAAIAQSEPRSAADRIAAQRDQAPAPATQAAPQEQGSSQSEAEADTAGVPANPNESLPLGVGSATPFQNGNNASGQGGGVGDGWLLSTLAALGVVLAIVFGIRWVMRRSGVAARAMPQGSVVEVLSRSTVAPRSHVLLMRVGTRVLVVSDSTAGMRTLASIEDPHEVAELLGAVDASRSSSVSQTFSSAMKRIAGQWGEESAVAAMPGDAADSDMQGVSAERTRSAVSDVRGRLAALSGAGGDA